LINKLLAISFAILVPIIVAIGAYYGTVVTPLLLIGAIAVCVVLVALGKIKGNLIYFYIFGMSLGLLYQTTMLGVDVVGSDIHNEFYYAKLNTMQGWDYTLGSTDNASFVIWFIAPLLSKLLMLDMVWVFKAILPIFLAIVPLVLFSVFKRQFGEMRAFFATIFFMIIPVFSMEVASIAKSMVAELFFALMVWVVVSNWKWQYKTLGICSALIMQIACHYTIGVLGICFLLGMFVIRFVSSPLKWSLFANRKVPLLVILLCLIIGGGAFIGYHGLTAGGAMATSVSNVVLNYVPVPPADVTVDTIDIVDTVDTVDTMDTVDTVNTSWLSNIISWPSLESQGASLVKTAIGVDFLTVPTDGKIFRIVQFLTQLMITIGMVRLFFNKFNVTAEFVGFIGASGVLLLACIFLTKFADTINMTRFYHLSLFFLSPLFVIGCETVGNMLTRGSK
jgi:uncharacterized membrane protein